MEIMRVLSAAMWLILICTVAKFVYCLCTAWKILRCEDSTSVSRIVSVFSVIKFALSIALFSWLIKNPDFK